MPSDPCDPLTESDIRIIRGTAGRLTRQAGFTRQDREDVEQELIRHVLGKLKVFDPTRAPRCAFVKTIVERRALSLARDRRAAKRGRGVVSLATRADLDSDAGELAQTIGQAELDARRRCAPRDRAELARLEIDVRSVIDRLPPDLRDLADRLRTNRLAEVARELDVPRSTLQYSLTRLRKVFEDAGLRGYLESGSSSRGPAG